MSSEKKYYFHFHPFDASDYSVAESRYSYTCGHCKTKVSGMVLASAPNSTGPTRWLMCPNCHDGSVLTNKGTIQPNVPFGPDIQGVPDDTYKAYNEARSCFSVNGFTACELICRKILMHVAVDKQAQPGDSFEKYINYLENQGYITPPMKRWVDLIRKHGNESTHELPNPDKVRAEGTLMFTAELLRLIYEMDHLAGQYTPKSP